MQRHVPEALFQSRAALPYILPFLESCRRRWVRLCQRLDGFYHLV